MDGCLSKHLSVCVGGGGQIEITISVEGRHPVLLEFKEIRLPRRRTGISLKMGGGK